MILPGSQAATQQANEEDPFIPKTRPSRPSKTSKKPSDLPDEAVTLPDPKMPLAKLRPKKRKNEALDHQSQHRAAGRPKSLRFPWSESLAADKIALGIDLMDTGLAPYRSKKRNSIVRRISINILLYCQYSKTILFCERTSETHLYGIEIGLCHFWARTRVNQLILAPGVNA